MGGGVFRREWARNSADLGVGRPPVCRNLAELLPCSCNRTRRLASWFRGVLMGYVRSKPQVLSESA
eukprot:8544191-Pyramimonas_sp.AAC.1